MTELPEQRPASARSGPATGSRTSRRRSPTADKVRLIDLLSATGLRRIEVTSFVRPDVIPQLADAERGAGRGRSAATGVAFSVLIPNERGLERALAMRDRFDEVSVFLSASETHNRSNVNRSIEESLAGLERTLATRARGRAALRGRDLDLLRLPLRGRGAARARLRDRRAARRRRLRGGRLRRHDRDGEPAPGRTSSSPPPASASPGSS